MGDDIRLFNTYSKGRCKDKFLAMKHVCGLSDLQYDILVEKYKDDTGWIPCGEKLPDRNDSYLVTICNYDETASINYRSIDHGNSDGSFLHCGTKKPRTKRGEYIVAWMPLPEPYREEDANE